MFEISIVIFQLIIIFNDNNMLCININVICRLRKGASGVFFLIPFRVIYCL